MPTKTRGRIHPLKLWLTGCAALFFAGNGAIATEPARAPTPISIIIDDIGDHHEHGLRAVKLPGKVTCAFLPHTPHSKSLARLAHRLGKEVMVHMPMESNPGHRLGSGGLTLEMERPEFIRTLKSNIAAIPYASGLNNHMGSLLTRHPGHMQWLMEALGEKGGLYFIDSRTTPQTVALQLARENGIPSRQRDIFLDDDASPAAVALQFKRLIDTAKRRGGAIAIGHPYDATMALLERELPRLEAMGLTLVPVSELLSLPDEAEQRFADEETTSGQSDRLVFNRGAIPALPHPETARQ